MKEVCTTCGELRDCTVERMTMVVDNDDWVRCWHVTIEVEFCSDKCRQFFIDTPGAEVIFGAPVPGQEPCRLRSGRDATRVG